MKMSLAPLLIIILLQVAVDTQKINSFLPKPNECGKLNENYFYNEKENVEFDEYPWIAQIIFKNVRRSSTFVKCGAILISKRHLLTNGACFQNASENIEPTGVMLGKINSLSNDTVRNCKENGNCGPEPQMYEIDDIGLHPNSLESEDQGIYRLHNIAIVRVAKDVEFNAYVQPICLPTTMDSNSDFATQYLPYVGYDLNTKFKRKIVAHIRSVKGCQEIYKTKRGLNISENNICASCNNSVTFTTGAALMDVAVDANKEPRFYLVGLMSAGWQQCSTSYPDILMRISSYLEWIMYNMV